MIIEYKFKNYRSFRDETTLSMIASQQTTFNDRLIRMDGLRVLPSVVIYGANASGKSNIIKSMALMREIIARGSSNLSDSRQKQFPLFPFFFSKKTNEIIEFSMEFINYKRKHYRYEFKMNLFSYEFLFEKLEIVYGKKYEQIYCRQNNTVEINQSQKVLNILKIDKQSLDRFIERININLDDKELFLTRGFKGVICSEIADDVMLFFDKELLVVSDFSEKVPNLFINMPKEKGDKKVLVQNTKLSKFMKRADIGPQKIWLLPEEKETADGNKKIEFVTTYKRGKNAFVFPAKEMESAGTIKLLEIAWPIYDAIEHGLTMILDEFDALLHPELAKGIILLFNDKSINTNNAQLIFSTHNPIFLNNKIFRRDQIMFVEKDSDDYSSTIYSLADFGSENVRNDENYMLNYFKGKYGALPFADFSELFNKKGEKNE